VRRPASHNAARGGAVRRWDGFDVSRDGNFNHQPICEVVADGGGSPPVSHH
jgi:hypothetical protein